MHDRVAGIAAGAGAAKARPQRAQRGWSAEQGAALVEHRDLAVDHLHDVAEAGDGIVLADGDVGVRRDITARADAAELCLRVDLEMRALFLLERLVFRARPAGPGVARRQRLRRGDQLQVLTLCPMRRRQIRQIRRHRRARRPRHGRRVGRFGQSGSRGPSEKDKTGENVNNISRTH